MWLTITSKTDTVLDKAIAGDPKNNAHRRTSCRLASTRRNCIRLSFAQNWSRSIEDAVARVGRIARELEAQ